MMTTQGLIISIQGFLFPLLSNIHHIFTEKTWWKFLHINS